MTRALMVMILFLTLNSAFSTSPDVIYGEDNRIDTIHSQSNLFRNIAKSTAAMISNKAITLKGSTAELHGPTLGEKFSLCEDQKFFHQPHVVYCSGFLVADNIIATAGHCMTLQKNCTDYSWVFDFKIKNSLDTSVSVSSNDVYKCEEIIQQQLDGETDFALVRPNRAVKGYPVVTISKVEAPVGTALVMIGHPSGLPQKIADGAKIISKSEISFKANLDAFQINSGSAVFNARTGEIVGILVNGATDYKFNSSRNCTEVNIIPNENAGEGVTSFKQFHAFLK